MALKWFFNERSDATAKHTGGAALVTAGDPCCDKARHRRRIIRLKDLWEGPPSPPGGITRRCFPGGRPVGRDADPVAGPAHGQGTFKASAAAPSLDVFVERMSEIESQRFDFIDSSFI